MVSEEMRIGTGLSQVAFLIASGLRSYSPMSVGKKPMSVRGFNPLPALLGEISAAGSRGNCCECAGG
ncbi:UNVERIFIED_ORG: hypothetical protein M2193_001842 [Bradyrhizobium japonicum]|uniref:hypothetical protein n=1 Tax=Bradyrhizobium TaxID=374 RepID=UPI0035D47F4D